MVIVELKDFHDSIPDRRSIELLSYAYTFIMRGFDAM